jgi:hypothetical protein
MAPESLLSYVRPSGLRDVPLRHVQLRAKLAFDLVNLPVALLDALSGREAGPRLHDGKEIAVCVDDRRGLSQRPPLDVLPLAGERQMHADVQSRIFLEQPHRFRKPRTRHDHVGRGEHTTLVGIDRRHIDPVSGRHVIAFDDQADLAWWRLQSEQSQNDDDAGAHVSSVLDGKRQDVGAGSDRDVLFSIEHVSHG